MEQVIVIAGPTCSGKTQLSLKLAESLKTEIISADSRQVYKFLDIGTAKPSESELKRVKHHFISSLTPGEKFNVSDFETAALKIIHDLHSHDKIPVVVGGSGLYIRALVDGLFNSVDTDEILRTRLMNERKNFGNEYLYEKLKKVDPESAAVMLPQNYKRIIRALEVYYLSGKPISRLQKEYKRDTNVNFLQYGLNPGRENLYRNIDTRVDKMFKSGLIKEVSDILERGFDKTLNALNTVGYKEVISYL
ncbi:MAG TPA: tRNA (adenosine(37)-N6)-dimethylallyltransferase MiaA, partial [Ignavibacteriaceae bacterium]